MKLAFETVDLFFAHVSFKFFGIPLRIIKRRNVMSHERRINLENNAADKYLWALNSKDIDMNSFEFKFHNKFNPREAS